MGKMNILEELGLKYGTDKIGKHNYLPVYYDMFKDRRNEVKKVLEIGVGEGAGLRMFRDFFPNATIYGAEIDERRIFKEDRIEVLNFDQASVKDIYNSIDLLSDMDLVIDDGSHNPLDQIFTCYGIMPFLKKDATYIIEDVADTDIIGILANKYYVDVKEVGKRYDDRMIIIKK